MRDRVLPSCPGCRAVCAPGVPRLSSPTQEALSRPELGGVLELLACYPVSSESTVCRAAVAAVSGLVALASAVGQIHVLPGKGTVSFGGGLSGFLVHPWQMLCFHPCLAAPRPGHGPVPPCSCPRPLSAKPPICPSSSHGSLTLAVPTCCSVVLGM